ncbi:hypothetical protein ACGYLO_11160 [Sulfitobacter sp. 1A13353]|uniref:hypothetical protein n=1 Tax=Sulfitobacter sp. 1A13353 TaxID=3368568 RepID=UPI0037474EF7
MRNLILASVVSLLALPASAVSIQGVWASNPQHCSGAYPETQVKITGNRISFIESTCTLENPTSLRGMPEAKLYDKTCSGEGSTWSERVLIGKDGDDLMIYTRGYVSTYQSC